MTTIHDVALKAGVSIKTVSRVVNNEANVRESTKKRVKEAIEELDFTPHLGARSLRSKRTGLVAMITGGIFSQPWRPFQTGLSTIPIVHGVQHTLRAAGKNLLFADLTDNEADFFDLVRVFRSHRVEGMLFSSTFHREVSITSKLPFPLVLVNCFDAHTTPAIVPDDQLAQKLVVQDMIENGHQSIAMVGLPLSITAGQLRHAGFLEAVEQAGISSEHFCFVEGFKLAGEHEVNVLDQALTQIFSNNKQPTAICFGNDLMTMRALKSLENMGIQPGLDVALWGFDNDLTICDSVHPTLTTMSLPYREMGVAAAKTLINRINGDERCSLRKKICGYIIKRQSSHPIPPVEA